MATSSSRSSTSRGYEYHHCRGPCSKCQDIENPRHLSSSDCPLPIGFEGWQGKSQCLYYSSGQEMYLLSSWVCTPPLSEQPTHICNSYDDTLHLIAWISPGMYRSNDICPETFDIKHGIPFPELHICFWHIHPRREFLHHHLGILASAIMPLLLDPRAAWPTSIAWLAWKRKTAEGFPVLWKDRCNAEMCLKHARRPQLD